MWLAHSSEALNAWEGVSLSCVREAAFCSNGSAVGNLSGASRIVPVAVGGSFPHADTKGMKAYHGRLAVPDVIRVIKQ